MGPTFKVNGLEGASRSLLESMGAGARAARLSEARGAIRVLGACAPALETRFASSQVFSGLGQGRKGGSVRAMVNTPIKCGASPGQGYWGSCRWGFVVPPTEVTPALFLPLPQDKAL